MWTLNSFLSVVHDQAIRPGCQQMDQVGGMAQERSTGVSRSPSICTERSSCFSSDSGITSYVSDSVLCCVVLLRHLLQQLFLLHHQVKLSWTCFHESSIGPVTRIAQCYPLWLYDYLGQFPEENLIHQVAHPETIMDKEGLQDKQESRVLGKIKHGIRKLKCVEPLPGE